MATLFFTLSIATGFAQPSLIQEPTVLLAPQLFRIAPASALPLSRKGSAARGAATVSSSPAGAITFEDLPVAWQCIAERESTDNPRAVNPTSGDEGAFQFALPTWAEYAPPGYPTHPIDATLSQQFDVALRVWQADGFSPWVTARLCGV